MLHLLTTQEKGSTKIKHRMPCLTRTYATLTLNMENLSLFQCIYHCMVRNVEHPDIVQDGDAPYPFPQWQIRLV